MRFLKNLFTSPTFAAALFLVGAALLTQSGPGQATLWKWSQTASSNSNADSTINWAEGMAPSAVNDSARAMMAAVAKFRDDTAGSIETGGTGTAYTLTTNQSLTSLTAGHRVCFYPNTTNTGTVTINVDSLGAKPLRTAPNVEAPAGSFVTGTPYCATYRTSNSGEWVVFSAPSAIPAGTIMAYGGSSAPTGYLLAYGQAVSRTTYAALFAVYSTTYGTGDGSTTFNLPDLRGRVPAGDDDMGGSAASRLDSFTTLGATIGAKSQTIAQANLPSVNLSSGGLSASLSASTSVSATWTSGDAEVIKGGTTGEFTAGSGLTTYRADTQTKHTPSGSISASATTTGSVTISGSVPLGGSGTPLTTVQPSIAVTYIIKY